MAFGARSGAGPNPAAAQIKRWMYDELGPDVDAVVTVSEVACTEPGCPPLETVVSVFPEGEESYLLKLAKPMVEVEQMDLVAVLAFGDHH